MSLTSAAVVLFVWVAEIVAEETYFTIVTNGTANQYVLHDEVVTWRAARDGCSAAGAQLLVPGDEAEARAVWSEKRLPLGNSIWIGIHDLVSRGTYQTIDGRPVSEVYQRWVLGQPNSNGGTLRCVLLRYDSEMFLYDCEGFAAYVCKFPAASERTSLAPTAPTALTTPVNTAPIAPTTRAALTIPTTPTAPTAPRRGSAPTTTTTPTMPTAPTLLPNNKTTLHREDCNEPCNKTFTIKLGGAEYVYHGEGGTWHQARDNCSAAGARLLAPEHAAEAWLVVAELMRANPGIRGIWIGINDLDNERFYLTLDNRVANTVHHYWAPGQPSSAGGVNRCAAMGPDTSLEVNRCDRFAPYVCKSNTTPSPTEIPC